MKTISRLLGLLLVTLMAGSQAAAGPPSLIVGVAVGDRVEVSAIPYAAGPWGTDYVTVSHVLRVGASYSITTDGKVFTSTRPIAACSAMHHGIDVLVLRVADTRSVARWGHPPELKTGDELSLTPWREHSGNPIIIRLLHHHFRTWVAADGWSPELAHTMVAQGHRQPGFSGSAWVRNGKVYGLHKGTARMDDGRIVALAEPTTRIKYCFALVGYTPPGQ